MDPVGGHEEAYDKEVDRPHPDATVVKKLCHISDQDVAEARQRKEKDAHLALH
jgi:hypothetical protein